MPARANLARRSFIIALAFVLIILIPAPSVAAAENPDAVQWLEKGKAYAGQNDYDKAINAYSKSIDIDSQNAGRLQQPRRCLSCQRPL